MPETRPDAAIEPITILKLPVDSRGAACAPITTLFVPVVRALAVWYPMMVFMVPQMVCELNTESTVLLLESV